jgi:hypothetical protein
LDTAAATDKLDAGEITPARAQSRRLLPLGAVAYKVAVTSSAVRQDAVPIRVLARGRQTLDSRVAN